MHQLIKYLGIFLILAGVIVLGIYTYNSLSSNTMLILSGLLMLAGLVAHIILNKVLDE